MCPMCNCEESVLLGQLGQSVYVRCRACGWDHTVEEEDPGMFADDLEEEENLPC